MPRPQAMFDQSAANMRKDFARDLIAHEAEQGQMWQSQVLNTAVANATGAIVSNTGGNDAGHVAKAKAALTADGLGQGLSGDTLNANTAIAFGRRVVEPVVTAKLGQGDVAGAKTFFDIHRDGMAADDADVLDRRLAEAGRASDTAATVDAVWKRLGPKNLNDPIDIAAIDNDLVDRHGRDDKALTRARDEVFHRLFGFTEARDETHAGYVNFAINRIKDGASPSQIATLPQFLALSEGRQQQITDWHRDRLADKLNGFAPERNLDRMAKQFAAYHDLSGSDALKQMSEAWVQALEPVLGEDLTKQALARKDAPPALDDAGFSLVAKTVGLDPAPGPLDVTAKARLGVLHSRVDAAIAAAEAASGPLSSEQRLKVALDAAATTVDGHPLFESPDVETILNVKPDAMKTPEPKGKPARPQRSPGFHFGDDHYSKPAFWPGRPTERPKIDFSLASYHRWIQDKAHRPADSSAGGSYRTRAGQRYIETSTPTGNRIVRDPSDIQADIKWAQNQERLQNIIESPTGAAAYGGAYLAGMSKAQQDRALELGPRPVGCLALSRVQLFSLGTSGHHRSEVYLITA